MGKRKNEFPLEVKQGNAIVKIYRTQAATGYTSYQVADHTSGKRKLLTFSNRERARTEALKLAIKMHSGEADGFLRGADVKLFQLACAELPEGWDLLRVVRTCKEALRILGGDHILEAARDFAKRHPATLPKITVQKLFEEFLASKEQRLKTDRKRGLSERYINDLRSRCGRFAQSFSCNIGDITTAQIQRFLDDLKLSSRSYINYRTTIGTMFEFAKRKGYLPKDHDEMDRIERIEDGGGEISIYTVGEMTRLLKGASHAFLPALAIGAFAGLRSAEIERLEWQDVHLDDRFIEVKQGKAKTASRRIIPIAENLASWLAPLARETGIVWAGTHDEFYEAQQETARKTGGENLAPVSWKANALRHSFISYRVAQTQDIAKVAMEAGNSTSVIHKHYRELVRPKEAEKWFSILPAESCVATD